MAAAGLEAFALDISWYLSGTLCLQAKFVCLDLSYFSYHFQTEYLDNVVLTN